MRRDRTPDRALATVLAGVARSPGGPGGGRRYADRVAKAAENVDTHEIERLRTELREAIEREAAVADLLRTIAGSRFDLQPVLQAVIERAVELCGADLGNLARRDGEEYHVAAFTGFPTREYERLTAARPYRAERGSIIGRAILDRAVVQIEDVLADPDYALHAAQRLGGYRTVLAAPMVRDGEIIGVIGVGRKDVQPFGTREVGLLETFAAQAAVAIELSRLLSEEHAAAARETAVSRILQEMARSSFDLQTVLESVIRSAVELSGADYGNILRYDEAAGAYRVAAHHGEVSAEFRELVREIPYKPDRGTIVGRTLLEQRPIHVVDVLEDPEYRFWEAQGAGGYRTILGVPMLRDGFPIGVFVVWRREIRPFSDREIALLVTFADQATLAIENVRLFRTVERQLAELTGFAPQVAALLTTREGETLLAGHRREITALFADLRDFTVFAEAAEPEEVLGMLREYHEAVGEVVMRHGGMIEHFAGDGMLVVFNDPVPLAGHELVAVRAAAAIRAVFEELASGWRRRGFELAMGIGLASGYATLGRIGFSGRYDYGAVGNVVILAARLSDIAQPGEILVSQRLQASIEESIQSEPVGPLKLKGMSRRVPAHRIIRVSPATMDPDR